MSDASIPREIGKSVWKSVRTSLVVASVQIAAGLLLSYAKKQGLIDADTMVRGVMVIIGLGLAVIGNDIPRARDGIELPTVELAALRQAAMRAAGWSLMLGGLAIAGVWAFAPRDVAQVGSMIALGGSLAVMCGFVTRWIFIYHRRQL
jgi:hypothetical protein